MAPIAKRYLVFLLLVLGVIAAAGAYYRYRAQQAVAECDMPAPPQKPATPPPNLPGFDTGAACGPGEPPPAPGRVKK